MISGVELADKGITPTKGEGSVSLVLDQTKNIILRLEVVLLVPGLRENLLSVPALVCSNLSDFSVLFHQGFCIFGKSGVEVCRMPLINNLWHLITGLSGLASTARASGPSDLSLWHLRLNHLNKRSLVEMVRKGLLPGVKLEQESEAILTCIGCGLGKMHRTHTTGRFGNPRNLT